jgi:hypothetical protein
VIPLIENDPVGVIKGAKLALLTVTDAVVARIPLVIEVPVPAVVAGAQVEKHLLL